MEEVKMKEDPPVVTSSVKTTLVFNVFTFNMIITLGAILLASIPYYDYFGLSNTREGLLISGIFTLCSYIVFILISEYLSSIALNIFIFSVWWISFSLFIGFVSASFYNITPIQCLLVSWGQSVSVILYSRMSPQKMEWYLSGTLMLIATTLVWIMSIYSYVVENDWIYSIGIFGTGLVLTAYNVWQIEQIKNRFDLSWEQSIRACAFYYAPFV
jgi:hypothetical protein